VIQIVFYQALLVIPALVYFYNKRVATISLAAIQILLLSLSIAGFVTLQFPQILIILACLVLLTDPGSNPQLLSIVTLISMVPLPGTLPLVSLALFIFIALSAKRCQKTLGLYMLIIIPLTFILQYLRYPFAALPLVLLLIGAPPFHKWFSDLYSNYRSTGVLVALTALTHLNAYQASYASLTSLLLFLGALMMIVGLFQCMVCKTFTELYSTSHRIVFGLLLVSASVSELRALFLYLLLPSIFTLSIIHFVHNSLAERTKKSGMFEFGGLSTGMKAQSACTLATYLILFTLVSLSSEIFMQIGISGNIEFILLGCITLFVAAASLAVFFRNYTLIYEGLSKSNIPSSSSQKFAVTALSAGNLVTALVPISSFSIFSSIGGLRPPEFEALNTLLLIVAAATILSAIIMVFAKPSKMRSWTTGYATLNELRESRGEIFTSWREIFEPIYAIKVPDDKASEIVGKINPIIIFVTLAVFAVIGEIL